ncbi:HDOD domain-containing protein [Paludibacterium yongneupense]|uniref:HDOD domain-containing protein n=1 Tax=Paludibacterium yongneupense TaxID=400061 RepID=UPI0004030F79|nr:HDOD domain-containing protein [Paludibacterium yongneupense]
MAVTQSSLLSAADREQLLKNLVIPPRPVVLDSLMKLRNDPGVNMQKIGQLIASDLALSAAVLKAANSPLISRGRRIASVAQAINLLGVKNVVNLVSGLVLRTRLTSDMPNSIEQFWERAMLVTMISTALAQHLRHEPEDCASYALFHGCGIALMLMRYPSYERTLGLIEMASDDRISRVENEIHGTSHDIVGYLVGTAWNMPESFCQMILLQHDAAVFDSNSELPLSPEARYTMAVARAATHVWRTLIPGNRDAGWDALRAPVLGLLGIGHDEFEDWCDRMHERLAG